MILSIFKENSDEIWERLSPKIVTVTKGWSEAYGLFLEGEADLVLSYTTSPAYHIMAEEEKKYNEYSSKRDLELFDHLNHLKIDYVDDKSQEVEEEK